MSTQVAPQEQPPSDLSLGTKSCNKCKRLRPLLEFPIKQRANPGKDLRGKRCAECLAKEEAKKEKENGGVKKTYERRKQDNLPLLELNDFLQVLDQEDVQKVEARVDLSSIEGSNLREKADSLVDLIWKRMDYRFIYHSTHKNSSGEAPTSEQFQYHCAQREDRQRPSKRTAEKTRDKRKMKTFPCKGALTVAINSARTDAMVKIKHEHGHIAYCSIDIPESVMQIVREGAEQGKTPVQVWDDILKTYPKPKFTRKSISGIMSRLDSQKWKRDEDQLVSAIKLLDEGRTKGGLGLYETRPIPLHAEDGFSGLAWMLPEMLQQWGGRIREVSLDSTWQTNGQRYELYALIGEAYGSGLPLGFLLLQSSGGAPGGKERYTRQFLHKITQEYNLKLAFVLCDKDKSEINALQAEAPTAKLQLCFWHAARAVKTRLSILRCMPAFYDVDAARTEFPWIDKDFVPVAQSTRPLTKEDTYIATRTIPRITIRLNNRVQSLPIPSKLGVDALPLGDVTNKAQSRVDVAGECLKDGAQGQEGECHSSTFDNAHQANLESQDIDDSEELGELLDKVDQELGDDDTDEEDGPDWMFEEGERSSPRSDYTFCPAPHRHQILRLFTKHFCQHPIFPEPTGQPTASQIRANAVQEMYTFCKQRGLREVWGYLWASWYSHKMWPLWARSASPLVSRLRTTMTVENFWKQLKHDYLHHLVRPRLDQLVYIISTKVVPQYMLRAEILEDNYRLGRAKPLTSFQRYFKRAWAKHDERELSGRRYKTNVESWTCNCGEQKYDTHHLCKHLVQAVPVPPMDFFAEVVRRRTVPLYKHPILRVRGAQQPEYADADDGSITDGDDHTWLGDTKQLTKWDWRDGNSAEILLGKRKRDHGLTDDDQDASSELAQADYDPIASSDPQFEYVEDSAEEEECQRNVQWVQHRADELREAADILARQTQHRNSIWLRSVVRRDLGRDAAQLVADIRHLELGRVRSTTWPRNKEERRRSCNTMGYEMNV